MRIAFSFLYEPSTRRTRWLRDLDTSRARLAGNTHNANRAMTLFQWAKLPYIRGAWEIRNSFIHGDIVTDSELLPLLLLDASDDDNCLQAFKQAYGISFEYFQTHANVIEAFKHRVYGSPARETKDRIIQLSQDMLTQTMTRGSFQKSCGYTAGGGTLLDSKCLSFLLNIAYAC